MNIIKLIYAGHPFSSLSATISGVIISIKFGNSNEFTLLFGITVLLAQLITGFTNDYLDYEIDMIYQPKKPLVKGLIDKNDIILINRILVPIFLILILFFDLEILLLMITGLILAQTYNFGLKNHPLSILVFTSSFGIMAIVPFVNKYGFEISKLPVKFFMAGVILGSSIHIVNHLIDYEIDRDRKSNSFLVKFGKKNSIRVVLIGYLLLLFIYPLNLSLIGLILICSILILFGFGNSPSGDIKEFTFYSVVILYQVILLIIPVH